MVVVVVVGSSLSFRCLLCSNFNFSNAVACGTLPTHTHPGSTGSTHGVSVCARLSCSLVCMQHFMNYCCINSSRGHTTATAPLHHSSSSSTLLFRRHTHSHTLTCARIMSCRISVASSIVVTNGGAACQTATHTSFPFFYGGSPTNSPSPFRTYSTPTFPHPTFSCRWHFTTSTA